MTERNVKVTTTSGFEDCNIIDYREPITAHVVVGMNFFKDFFSSFTDVFGGKSGTYQNTLASINDEVINKLRKKAYSLGANCVLGLKIDNDEVSAQGKSMMMVTALGTAAIANFSKDSGGYTHETKKSKLSSEHFNMLYQKKHLIDDSKEGNVKINNAFWEFVKQNRINELSDFILSKYENFTSGGYYEDDLNKMRQHILEYFSLIDSEKAEKKLYDKLKEESTSTDRERIESIIIELGFINYQLILELLMNSNFYVQKSAIMLSTANKKLYDIQDISLIEKLVKFISDEFSERGEKTTKKVMLSSKEKEIWVCECGNENNNVIEYCTKCSNDIFGFKESHIKPEQAISYLNETKEILKTTLSNND